MAKKGKQTIQLLHTSLSFRMTADEVEHDLRQLVLQSDRPDILTTTETSSFVPRFRQVMRSLDYRPIEHKHKGCMMAVNVARNKVHVKDQGAVFLIDGKPGLYSARTINWVVIMFHGVRVFHHVAHWVPPHAAGYMEDHRLMTNALVTQVRKHGKKKNVSFFAGDINEDDDPQGRPRGTGWNQILRENGLMTIWDEKGVYPPTMGGGSRTIDVVGKYKEDHVKGLRYRIWPKLNSDHRPMSAWYEIDLDAKTKEQDDNGGAGGGNDGGGNGGGGDNPDDGDHSGDPKDPDFYSTGGDVSWEDYLDTEIYNLPAATDDSDTTNG